MDSNPNGAAFGIAAIIAALSALIGSLATLVGVVFRRAKEPDDHDEALLDLLLKEREERER